MSGNPSVSPKGVLYRVANMVAPLYFRVIYKLRVEGIENIPSSGGIIIASNHISNLDPPLIGVLVPRYIKFMAKAELFRLPVLKHMIQALGAFPIRRGMVDKQAIRTAVDVVQQGGCLVMFPEGHRSKTGALGEFLPGVASIARKAQGLVVPVVIMGPYRVFGPLRVKFGQPISVASLKSAEILDVLKKQMELLRDDIGRIQ